MARNKTLLALQLAQRGMASKRDGAAPGGAGKRQRLLAPLPAQAAAGGGVNRVVAGDNSHRAGKGSAGSRGAKCKEPGPGTIQLGDGAAVRYATDLLAPAEAAALFEQLRHELPWEQRSVHVMGRTVLQPRLIEYQADSSDLQYTYSGATLQPSAWHPAVAALKARVEAAVGSDAPAGGFNSCLLNWYRSGQDSIAWHSDSEPLYGRRPTIGARVAAGVGPDVMEELQLSRQLVPSLPCPIHFSFSYLATRFIDGLFPALLCPCCICSLCFAGRLARLLAAPQRRPRRQVPF